MHLPGCGGRSRTGDGGDKRRGAFAAAATAATSASVMSAAAGTIGTSGTAAASAVMVQLRAAAGCARQPLASVTRRKGRGSPTLATVVGSCARAAAAVAATPAFCGDSKRATSVKKLLRGAAPLVAAALAAAALAVALPAADALLVTLAAAEGLGALAVDAVAEPLGEGAADCVRVSLAVSEAVSDELASGLQTRTRPRSKWPWAKTSWTR